MNNRLMPGRMVTDMIHFYKTSTLNAWNSIALFQEQTERTLTTMMELPLNAEKEFFRMWQELLGSNKKSVDEFGRMLEKGFDTAQEFFAPRSDS